MFLAAPATAKELPRVLFVGDYIQQRIIDEAAKELKGEIAIHHPKATAVNTGEALDQLDEIIGDGNWDVIYFNYGIGDLFYRDPKSKEIRALSKYSGGVRTTSPRDYEKNLDELVTRLKKTGAKLIWSTTTPLLSANAFPSYTGNLFDEGSAKEYNQIAGKVMVKHQVPTCDLFTHILSQYKEDERHPQFDSYQRDMQRKNKAAIEKPIVDALRNSL